MIKQKKLKTNKKCVNMPPPPPPPLRAIKEGVGMGYIINGEFVRKS